MRKSRFSEEQIIRILGRVEAGELVKDICREIGVAENTYYRWKAKYGGMSVSDARRLKELEVENRRLKTAVAELTLDKQALKEVLLEPGQTIQTIL
jgi:putative transposase